LVVICSDNIKKRCSEVSIIPRYICVHKFTDQLMLSSVTILRILSSLLVRDK